MNYMNTMRKLIYSFVALLCIAQMVWAGDIQPSTTLTTYYAAADGKADDALRLALQDIIDNHIVVSYSSLGTLMQYSDTEDADGKNVIDIYTDCTFTVNGPVTWISSGNVGDGMNREHTVPQSWFNKQSPMVSDAFHIYPTDCKTNNNRSSYLYGEFEGAGTSYSSNKCSESGKLSTGTSNSIAPYTYNGQTYAPTATWSGKVYEPDDEYKGDLARGYFYMATRYADVCANWSGGAFGNDNNGLATYTAELMLKWHRMDPVSEKELLRNEVIYGNKTYNKSDKMQKNRNPFIDYPELVEYIWGNKKGQTVALATLISAYDPDTITPVIPDTIVPIDTTDTIVPVDTTDTISPINPEAIETTSADAYPNASKLFINGHLYILVCNEVYTITGQRVK